MRKSLMISQSDGGNIWTEPIELELPDNMDINQVDLAGLSFDGFTLYLSVGEKHRAICIHRRLRIRKL